MTIEIVAARVELLEKQVATLLADKVQDVPVTKPKKVKKEKKEASDDDKPKQKRVSGYILFSKALRDEVKDNLAKEDEKPKNTEVMVELARLWKALDDEERGEWNNKAKAIKENLAKEATE